MINYPTAIKFQDAGIQLDMVGHKLQVGDTILTKSYGSAQLDSVATIIRVNKKSVSVNVARRYWSYGAYVPRPANWDNSKGYWNCYPNRKLIEDTKAMTRRSYECLKVDPDFAEQAAQREAALVDEHPELFI